MSRQQRVNDLIAKWQPRFGLQAWDVRHDGTWSKKDNKSAVAVTRHEKIELKAQIFIDPSVPDTCIESLVLHELMHLVFADIIKGETNFVAERAIDNVVHALCGRKPLPPAFYDKRKMPAFGEGG